MKPLNGEKTHPLSQHAYVMLADLKTRNIPLQEINAGLLNRLMRENLIDIVERPSPYKAHKGRNIAHAKINAAGLAVLGNEEDA